MSRRTPEQTQRAVELERLRRHRLALAAGRVPGVIGRPAGTRQPPEARAAIREAALRRWAEIKRGKE